MKRTRRCRQCAGTLGECEEKTREETIVERRRVSRKLVETPLRCAPKTFRLPFASVPKKREPQTKKKKIASESSAWGRLRPNARRPPPHRSLRRTTTLPEIVSAHRDRGRIDPHQSQNVSKAPDFFFFPLSTPRKKATLIQHIFARRDPMAPPFCDRCANVGNPRAASVRVVFVFRSAKKRTIFLFFVFFFCCCCYFVAGLERVLCGAPNAYSF